MTSEDEKRWQAECDARTLMSADMINQDPKRLSEAKSAAKRMVETERKEAESMARVAGSKTATASKKPTPNGLTINQLTGL